MKKTRDLPVIPHSTETLDPTSRIKALEDALFALASDNESLSAQVRDMAEAEKTHLSEIAKLKGLVEKLAEELANQRAARFGRKSETFAEGQLVFELFNEVEAFSDPNVKDQFAQEAPLAAPRKKGGRKPTDISHLPVLEVIDHKLDDKACPQCGSEMDEIGYEVVREVVHLPSVLGVREHHVYKYLCSACSEKNALDQSQHAVIARAEGPHLPLPKSMEIGRAHV